MLLFKLISTLIGVSLSASLLAYVVYHDCSYVLISVRKARFPFFHISIAQSQPYGDAGDLPELETLSSKGFICSDRDLILEDSHVQWWKLKEPAKSY